MVDIFRLQAFCDEYLRVDEFTDYCPNGLQVEASREVARLVSGVTASQALIEAAAALNADALLVHHGFFWKGESPCITGIKGSRVRSLIHNGVSLLAYHLPLDDHPEVGNNRRLADHLGILHARPCGGGSLLWQGRLRNPMGGAALAAHIAQRLGREPVHIQPREDPIEELGWCTGAAQDSIEQAAALGLDAYISGEISERTAHQAHELGIHYFAAGHHATERYGVQALGERLAREFGLTHRFVEVYNPA